MKKKLDNYNKKRDFSKTKEPVGLNESSSKKLRFVVQHHLARKEHYDLRLELDGVLVSFAIPKGPSYNHKDKRLCIHVEDHPLSYRNFEGTIPKGEYGGGTVMIFDEGFWVPIGNARESLKHGSLKFILNGKRLYGKWALIHFKDKNWLLIKEKDNVSGFSDIQDFTTSVRTNRTMEEIERANKEKNLYLRFKKDMNDVVITNPKKIIYSKPKILKEDIVSYYKKVMPRMMPFLENRIISTVRSPNGITGDKFYKKHFETTNKGLGVKKIPSHNEKKEDYYYVLHPVGLITEVQMNGYEFHIWGSNTLKVSKPDMIVFDLDPDKKLSLNKVRQGVLDLKSILDSLSLISFLKTSGGKGYHVVVPIQSLKNFEEAKDFSQKIAQIMERKWPDKYTSNVRMINRKGKIFIDFLRNTQGATSVCPYSIRLKKKLRVSMPIRWNELFKVKPDEITMDMAILRLKRKDPWDGFWNVSQ